MYPISSNLPQQLLRVLSRRHREQMFPPGETVIAAGQGLERAILLDSQNVNVVFVSHIHIAHTASDPAVKRRNLVDGVFVRQLDIIKYIPCAQGRVARRSALSRSG